MSRYAIKIRQSPGWQDNDAAVVSISMGHQGHEGDKLEALLEWAPQQFKYCYLNISDTLQRHNLMREGLDEAEAHAAARRMGDDWIERNQPALKAHKHKYTAIHRWDDWLYHANFKRCRAAVCSNYVLSGAFRDALQNDCRTFLSRREEGMTEAEKDEFMYASLHYILEEVAVYTLMGKKYRPNKIYPAQPLQSFEYLRQEHPGLSPLLHGLQATKGVHILYKRMREDQTARKNLPGQPAPL